MSYAQPLWNDSLRGAVPAVHEVQHHEKPSQATVTVEEWMNGLELIVQQRAPHKERQPGDTMLQCAHIVTDFADVIAPGFAGTAASKTSVTDAGVPSILELETAHE